MIQGGSGSDRIYGGSGMDFLVGDTGADVIAGGDEMDILEGGLGDDVLDGGDSLDFLSGGLGSDTLIGGSSGDFFRFRSSEDGNDTISDFESSETVAPAPDADKIELEILPVNGYWIGASAFSGTGDAEARFDDQGADNGLVQVDVDGDGTLDFDIEMVGFTAVSQLTSSDFMFLPAGP